MKDICFITRYSRNNSNLKQIFNSINNLYINYYWLILIDQTSIKNIQTLNIFLNLNLSNIIIFNNINKTDKYFTSGLNIAINSIYAKNSKFIYILDDDNIVHKNLSTLINNDADLIISKIDNEKNIILYNPKPFAGKIDWSNMLMKSSFLRDKNIIIHNDQRCDGHCAQDMVNKGAKVHYSNIIAAYYNYLK